MPGARLRPLNLSALIGPASAGLETVARANEGLSRAIMSAGSDIGQGIARGRQEKRQASRDAESDRRWNAEFGLSDRRMALAEDEAMERRASRAAAQTTALEGLNLIADEVSRMGQATPQHQAAAQALSGLFGGPDETIRAVQAGGVAGTADWDSNTLLARLAETERSRDAARIGMDEARRIYSSPLMRDDAKREARRAHAQFMDKWIQANADFGDYQRRLPVAKKREENAAKQAEREQAAALFDQSLKEFPDYYGPVLKADPTYAERGRRSLLDPANPNDPYRDAEQFYERQRAAATKQAEDAAKDDASALERQQRAAEVPQLEAILGKIEGLGAEDRAGLIDKYVSGTGERRTDWNGTISSAQGRQQATAAQRTLTLQERQAKIQEETIARQARNEAANDAQRSADRISDIMASQPKAEWATKETPDQQIRDWQHGVRLQQIRNRAKEVEAAYPLLGSEAQGMIREAMGPGWKPPEGSGPAPASAVSDPKRAAEDEWALVPDAEATEERRQAILRKHGLASR